jgi:glyoxylase-like metal-dependent hydrolase (beta-lactamase superfamily II)
MIKLTYQSYIVKTPQHTVLLDTCIGNDKTRPARPAWTGRKDEHFMHGLAAIGLTPGDIDYVMCTHLHVDHVGWNTKLENGRWVPTFPKARYLFSAKELAHWEAQHAKTPLEYIADSVLPIMEAKKADLVKADHALNDYFTLTPTPGHTVDHYSVRLGRGGKDALYTGDAIHSLLQLKYPELPMRVDYDGKQGGASRRKMLEELCDTPTLCCAAHFPEPSVGRIKRDGNGFRCEFVE